MKKIFTLMAAALTAASSWAAVPQLLFGDVPVVPGETYQTGYSLNVMDLGAIVLNQYTQDADLFLKGYLGEDVTVVVNATSSVSVCSIDGNCMMGTTVTKEGSLGVANVVWEDDEMCTVSLMIDKNTDDMTGADPASLLSDITVNVKAYYTDTPAEYTETTVVLTARPESEIGGVSDVKAEASIVLTAPNVLTYNVASPTKLDIYNVNGALVLSRTICHNGTLSLDSLHPGVYIYSAAGHTGKILVRK